MVEIEQDKFIKIGSTKDVAARIQSFRRNYNNPNICFLDIFECQNFREVEENILQDDIIKNKLFKDAIAGNYSKEIVELTPDLTLNKIINIIKKYINNNINLFTPEQLIEKNKIEFESKKLEFDLLNKLINSENYSKTIDDIIKEKLPSIMEKINFNNVINEKLSIETNNNVSKEIDNKIIDGINYKIPINANIRPHKPMGRKVLKIDPDNLNKIIKIYDSISYVFRDMNNKGFVKSNILQAIKGHRIYKGYRWAFVEKNEDPNNCIIKPTVKTRRRISDTILEINSDKTKILNSYPLTVQRF